MVNSRKLFTDDSPHSSYKCEDYASDGKIKVFDLIILYKVRKD